MNTILTVTDNHKHFSSAIDEYTKRLGKDLSIISLKPQKHGTQPQIIAHETQSVIDFLEKKTFDTIFVLSPLGKNLTTKKRQQHIQYKKCCFVIGGPYGLDYDKLPYTHLSLGSQTMPHGLAALILAEQLYRIQTLLIGKTYHY